MESITFQIIDWIQYNESGTIDNNNDDLDDLDDYSDEYQDNSEDELELEKELNAQQEIDYYKIRLYGKTQDNKSIIVNVNNYTPFFYIKVPKEWNEFKIRTLISYIKSKISSYIIRGFKGYDILIQKDFYGFTNYGDFKFVRLIFYNMCSYKYFENWISRNSIMHNTLGKQPFRLKLYESNIEPFIRCMHIRKLNACGWVKITKYEKYDESYSYDGIALQTDWTNLESQDINLVQKFITVSFDIECMSLSGNFPQAIDPTDYINLKETLNKIINDMKENSKYKYKKQEELMHIILTNPKLYSKYNKFEFKYEGDPIIQIGSSFSYYCES